MGDSSTSFTEASVLAEASAIDGLTDFGDPSFREPLRVLLDSLAQAPLNALGSGLLRGSVVRSLRQEDNPPRAFVNIRSNLLVRFRRCRVRASRLIRMRT